MKTIDNQQQPMTTIDSHQQPLTTIHNHWQPTTTSDNQRQPITNNSKTYSKTGVLDIMFFAALCHCVMGVNMFARVLAIFCLSLLINLQSWDSVHFLLQWLYSVVNRLECKWGVWLLKKLRKRIQILIHLIKPICFTVCSRGQIVVNISNPYFSCMALTLLYCGSGEACSNCSVSEKLLKCGKPSKCAETEPVIICYGEKFWDLVVVFTISILACHLLK